MRDELSIETSEDRDEAPCWNHGVRILSLAVNQAVKQRSSQHDDATVPRGISEIYDEFGVSNLVKFCAHNLSS